MVRELSKIINLGIKPVHYDFLNCIEDAVISAIEWAGYRYELLFSEAWSFPFDLKDYNVSQNLGTSLKVNHEFDENAGRNLEKYHGIKGVVSDGISLEKVIKTIRCELENNRPVMVSMDSFFCPWDWNYGKHYSVHAFLVTGIGDNGELFCCDGFFRTCKTITKEELERGYLGWYVTFSFAGNEKVDVNWREILENAVHQLKEANPLNCFDSIRKYADVLENKNDIKKEIQGYEDDLFLVPLIYNLESIAYGRRKFAKLLNYFEEGTGIQTLQVLSNNLIEIASLWANVRAMLLKTAFLDDLDEISLIKQKVVKRLRDIADKEESTANQLLELCQRSSTFLTQFSNRRSPIGSKVEIKNTAIIKNVFMVDLSSHFNNKAFGESISSDCSANFTGTGAYLLKENIPDTETWKNGAMEFKISGFRGSNDNISCNGQIVPIKGESHQSILILGTAEWGSFTDKLTIHFMNGQIEEVHLRFTEWIYKPLYGETDVWEGRGVEKINGNVQLMRSKVHLFVQQYPIQISDKIDFLQLPDSPCIHIFAITLV